MEEKELKEYIERLVGQLVISRADQKSIKNKIDAIFGADKEWQGLNENFGDAKSKKKYRELELTNEGTGKELVDKKDEVNEKIKEIKSALSSALETYSKKTGEFIYKTSSGKELLMVRSFSFKAKQMRLFE